MSRGALLLAVLIAVATACGGRDDVLSVEEASGSRGDAEVTGFLHATGDDVRLCAAVLESFPPQCGRPSIRVNGLDPGSIEGMEREGSVAWKEGVTLTGTIADGVLTVDP